MRKIILVASMVLVSASAQAGDRSLSMSAGTEQTSAPQITTVAAPTTHISEVAPATEAPKYVDRPPAIPAPAPVVATAPAVTTTAAPAPAPAAKPVKTAKAGRSKHVPYWSERRIIAELHRHGIYFYW
jgi:hypothetical protein